MSNDWWYQLKGTKRTLAGKQVDFVIAPENELMDQLLRSYKGEDIDPGSIQMELKSVKKKEDASS